MTIKNVASTRQIYLKFFIFSILLVSIYVFVDYLFYANQTKRFAIQDGLLKIREKEKVLNNFLKDSQNNLLALKENQQFQTYLHTKKNLNDINNIFYTFVKSQSNIMQLRYINKNGLEVVRIDKNQNGTLIIEKKALQDKSSRYYFQDSLKKPLEQVWFSPLDLNIENGKVQIPYNPTIRAILPLKKNNTFDGILIINYFMKDFLDQFVDISFYDAILFDSNGYILKHPNTTKEWGFYKDNQLTLKDDPQYAKEFTNLISHTQVITSEFVSHTLQTPIQNRLHLLLKLKQSYLHKEKTEQLEHYIIVSGITFLMSLALTIFIGNNIFSLFKFIKKQALEQNTLLSLFDKGDSVLFKWNNDTNSTIDYVSSNVENLLGYTKKEFMDSKITYTDCIFKDDLHNVIEEINAGKNSKHDFFRHKPYRVITKSGEIKWVLDYTVIEKDIDGKIIHLIGYIIDISEHEKTKRNLEKFIDTQDNIVILTDGKEINFANKKFFTFLGYHDLEEFKTYHKSICELFIENDRFFHSGKYEKKSNWLEMIHTLPPQDRIVSILSANFNAHAFSISTNKFNDKLTIVSFNDISSTVIQHIQLEEKTIRDKLTGAYNREYFEQNIEQFIKIYQTNHTYLAIAFLDIDHFKKVNDTYGHDVGDELLISFVRTIKKYSREEDILIRWGGEEFIMIIKTSSKENFFRALENLRAKIANEDFPIVGKKTCSIGGTIYQEQEDISLTIKRADEAVYDAKNSGRNKVIIQ